MFILVFPFMETVNEFPMGVKYLSFHTKAKVDGHKFTDIQIEFLLSVFEVGKTIM